MQGLLRTAIAVTVLITTGLINVTDSIGQISITENTFLDLVDKRLTDVAWDATDLSSANALRDNLGTDRVWDVTGVPFILRDTTEIDFLSSIQGTVGESIPEFGGANIITTFSELDEGVEAEVAIYWENFTDRFKHLGSVHIGEFVDEGVVDTFLVISTPGQVQFEYPFSFGTIIADSVTSSVYAADTLVWEQQIALDGEVDGWGTLITPAGQIDVLRYRFERRTYSMGLLVDSSVDIEWWNENGLVMGMEIDDSGNAADLSYFDLSVSNPTSTDKPRPYPLETFFLRQNYPNPFDQVTTIPLELTKSGYTRLIIYDSLGRRVAVLIDDFLPAGRHELIWNADGISAGLFHAKIDVEGSTESRTIALIK